MFYTYIHRRNDTGRIFYVGKGCGRRAYSSLGRGRHWRAVASLGHTVEICAWWPVEADAFEHEVFLIQVLRDMGEPLVNKTDGGEGCAGRPLSPTAAVALRRPEVHARRVAGMRAALDRPEVRATKSAAQQAAQRTPEARAKQRLSRLQSPTPGGRRARPVRCLSTGDWFESVADAGRHFGVLPQNVASACRGERSHVAGLHFEFATAPALASALP